MSDRADINKLVDVMRALRDPNAGCPWDLQQDASSLARYTLEEAYEVVDAIDSHDMQQLKQELGDLLFQVVFHSSIASENGFFTLQQVVDTIVEKLIRRHPHVFPVEGQVASRNVDDIRSAWEQMKAQERKEKGAGQLLDDIPMALPAMQRAQKIQSRLATIGFDWTAPEPVLAQLQLEIEELVQVMHANEQDAVAEEMGDVLFSCVNLARHLHCDPESVLRAANNKVLARLNWMEQHLSAAGEMLSEQSTDRLEHLWQQAKRALSGTAVD